MSSQKGNVARTRTQKYKNRSAFKNDLHDKTQKIKMIKNLTAEGICQRCKDIIDWKIKYKKYKPLTQPAHCVRCHQKTVKRAYYTVCQPCATAAEVCAKCNIKQTIVVPPEPSEQEKMAQDKELQFELKQLTERQRRAFNRHLEKGDTAAAKSVVEDNVGDDFGFDSDKDDDDDYDNKSDVSQEENDDGAAS